MTEFNELDLDKDVEDMSEAEAKTTLSDFMASHRKNREAYDAAVAEAEEVEAEYKEQIDELEEKVSEFKQRRADEAAEYTNVPADIMAERFTFSELEKIIEEGQDADFSEEDEESNEEEESLTTFTEREQKGRKDGSGPSEYRELAEKKIHGKW